uniref:Homologous recombination OB-fold protein OB-fold domain-containing protein n=1 Tax=Tanacetum cinerariifolium TaxID=118510 RepID=A0A6L2KPV0_TANCI|nr:hypothetical protein [Tanacetum cinerariifolium]
MACSVSHTSDEIKAMVEKQIEEDKARQLAIMNLAVEYGNACGAKYDLRKAYEECNHIPQETRALIATILKEGSNKDYEMHNSLFENVVKIEKQMNAKLVWLREKCNYRSQTHIGGSSSQTCEICDVYLTKKELSIRIIPDHAGIVKQAQLLKERDILLGWDGAVMSTQDYTKKVVEDVGDMRILRVGCTIPETIHHKVIGDRGYGKCITVEAGMILANVSVFTLKPSKYYLNSTMRNVVKPLQPEEMAALAVKASSALAGCRSKQVTFTTTLEKCKSSGRVADVGAFETRGSVRRGGGAAGRGRRRNFMAMLSAIPE